MEVQFVDSTLEMESLYGEWRRLAGPNPLHSLDWLAAWWESFGGGNRLCVLVVRDSEGRAVAIAPWYLESNLWGKAIRALGSGKVCTDYLSVLSSPRDAQVAFGAIARVLRDGAAGCGDFRLAGTQFIELDGVVSDADWLREFSLQAEQEEFTAHTIAIEKSWRLTLPSDWKTYLGSLDSNWRRKARKAEKRIASGEVSVHQSTRTDFVESMELVKTLHQRRRESVGDKGAFADSRFEGFLDAASERLLQQGKVRIVWCERDGVPIAAQYQLLGTDTVYMYQSGMSPDALDLEPGHTMMVAALQAAIAEGWSVFDFLRGDERYKEKWGGRPVGLARVRFVAPQWPARLHSRFITTAKHVRNVLFPR